MPKNKLNETAKICIIGRLRMCSDGEECVETPHTDHKINVYSTNNTQQAPNFNSTAHVLMKTSDAQKIGTCVALNPSKPNQPISNLSIDISKPNNKSHTNSNSGWHFH